MDGLMMHYPLTTNTILEYGNSAFPHKKLISHLPDGTRHEYSYGDLYKRTKQLANALSKKLGVTKGDMVGTFAWNHYQHVELYYGIPAIGAVCHTINIRLSPQQTEFIINHSEDKIIFVDATLVPLLEKISTKLETVEHFIIINAPKEFSTTLSNTLDYEELLSGQSETFEVADPKRERCQRYVLYKRDYRHAQRGVIFAPVYLPAYIDHSYPKCRKL